MMTRSVIPSNSDDDEQVMAGDGYTAEDSEDENEEEFEERYD